MISVIGGSGFIGSSLCTQLEENGIEFIILDKVLSKKFPNKTILTDVNDLEQLEKNISGDLIINLSAVHKDNIKPTSLYYKVNCDGAKNICEVAKNKNIKRIIFLSSVAVYGINSSSSEKSTLKPFNDYGKSKEIAENIFKEWHDNNPKSNLIIIRPTAVFGRGNRGNIYNLINQINSGTFIMIGNGKNIKSIAYVENLSSFIIYSLKFIKGFHLFNYSDKPDFTTRELVELIYEILKKKTLPFYIPYGIGILGGVVFDLFSLLIMRPLSISRIRVKKFASNSIIDTKAFDEFKPLVNLEKALKETIEHEFYD